MPSVPDLPKSVFIVGNAPATSHPLAGIEAADWVVRFNNAPGFGTWSGARCTHLALVNHGGQMREWLEEPGFRDRPALRAAREILFPFPAKPEPVEAQSEDGRDWTREARRMLEPLGVPVSVIPAKVHAEARRILATPEHQDPNPSTGFLVTLHLLAKLSSAVAIEASGFGFAGWSGHAWEGERRWFEARAGEGRIRLHPVQSQP